MEEEKAKDIYKRDELKRDDVVEPFDVTSIEPSVWAKVIATYMRLANEFKQAVFKLYPIKRVKHLAYRSKKRRTRIKNWNRIRKWYMKNHKAVYEEVQKNHDAR